MNGDRNAKARRIILTHGDAVRALYEEARAEIAAYAITRRVFRGEEFRIPPDARRRYAEAEENLRVLRRIFVMADLMPQVEQDILQWFDARADLRWSGRGGQD